MVRVTVVVREPGKPSPDYSLDFDLPEIPAIGTYISIQRPSEPDPYGEDMIVRHVWWRLDHPETGGFASGAPKIGKAREIFVECDPAVGPYSSDRWRDMLEGKRRNGLDIEDMSVARVSVRQDQV